MIRVQTRHLIKRNRLLELRKQLFRSRSLFTMPPDDTNLDEAQRSTSSSAACEVDDAHADRQYLFIIRHGDRWDYSHPEWKKLSTSRLGDSPLSPLGHSQAREVGEFLDAYLSERNLAHDITWLSSPFLRCLQTSNEALNAMKIANSHYNSSEEGTFREIPIKPEYSICKYWGQV